MIQDRPPTKCPKCGCTAFVSPVYCKGHTGPTPCLHDTRVVTEHLTYTCATCLYEVAVKCLDAPKESPAVQPTKRKK
jgi:hypothetical protein